MSIEDTGPFRDLLNNVPEFSSCEVFRGFCRSLVSSYNLVNKGLDVEGRSFDEHLSNIKNNRGHIIETSWGGVDILSYVHPNVEKFLVIEAGKYLAFEKHDEKIETLLGEEGFGVLVYRPLTEEIGDSIKIRPPLKAEIIKPGFSITLQPGQEHTIVALSNLLVREKSQDFKGMDKDLIFIYTPADT